MKLVLTAAPIGALSLLLCLTGCASGPGGETTCREWHAYDDGDPFSSASEQLDIVKKMLADNGKEDFGANVILAETAIAGFCGTDGYLDEANADQPIQNGVNLD